MPPRDEKPSVPSLSATTNYKDLMYILSVLPNDNIRALDTASGEALSKLAADRQLMRFLAQ